MEGAGSLRTSWSRTAITALDYLLLDFYLREKQTFVEVTVILDPVTNLIPTDRLLCLRQPSFIFICNFSSKPLVPKITLYIYLYFYLYF